MRVLGIFLNHVSEFEKFAERKPLKEQNPSEYGESPTESQKYPKLHVVLNHAHTLSLSATQ